ncbi:MAG: histidinol-phosphate transaminase [Pseudomonadales bacterium]|nr:histidinol-phosphate transaminase [Pseudomonadales bacterium]
MPSYQRPNIQAMAGYTWGEQPDDRRTIKLNTNENPYPPSPAVDEAIAAITGTDLRRYPQPTADPLRVEIAKTHGIEQNQIVITNGGDEALRLAITTFVEPTATIAVTEPSYSLYPVLADIHGSQMLRIKLGESWEFPENFAQRANEAGAQLTCIVNPHAPSGTLVDTETLSTLADALDGVLLVDEAYVDFVDPELDYDCTSLINKHDNVLVLRSFSKGYGLAGMRLGYLFGTETLIDPIITKTRDSYNIDHISQAVGLAAFTDQAYAQNTWTAVREQRNLVRNALLQLGLESPPSQTNFILATVTIESPANAEALYEALKNAGILVRYFPTMKDKLRITIGTPQENEQLIATLTKLLT